MLKNNKYYKSHKKEVEKISDRTTAEYFEACPTIERIIYNDAIEDDKINEDFKENVLKKASITEEIYKND